MSEHADEIATRKTGPPQDESLPWARRLADLLTLCRLLGGVALALMTWEKTVVSLGRLVKCNLLLWSTDAVDGRIARHSRTPASWIGERDALVDSALTLGTGVALVRSGYLPVELIAIWLGTCLVLYAIKPVNTIVLTFMFPLQITLPVLALVHGCPEVRLYVIWVAAVAFASWKRLKWVIEVFISGLPDRQQAWVWSWLPGWLRLTSEERESFEVSDISGTGDVEARDSWMSL